MTVPPKEETIRGGIILNHDLKVFPENKAKQVMEVTRRNDIN
ncbi:hypothetical protein ACD591_10480 [Rufibacter glacialis]|uniref:Uncharacterized protein n=1 Tax=Rufibacter glacialis TaxID=1259555 RepID=A0ABV4RF12_9BACT|nr:hypothetical protein [Rufibacter glacialis]